MSSSTRRRSSLIGSLFGEGSYLEVGSSGNPSILKTERPPVISSHAGDPSPRHNTARSAKACATILQALQATQSLAYKQQIVEVLVAAAKLLPN